MINNPEKFGKFADVVESPEKGHCVTDTFNYLLALCALAGILFLVLIQFIK